MLALRAGSAIGFGSHLEAPWSSTICSNWNTMLKMLPSGAL